MRGAVVPLCGVCSSVPQPIIFSRAFRKFSLICIFGFFLLTPPSESTSFIGWHGLEARRKIEKDQITIAPNTYYLSWRLVIKKAVHKISHFPPPGTNIGKSTLEVSSNWDTRGTLGSIPWFESWHCHSVQVALILPKKGKTKIWRCFACGFCKECDGRFIRAQVSYSRLKSQFHWYFCYLF